LLRLQQQEGDGNGQQGGRGANQCDGTGSREVSARSGAAGTGGGVSGSAAASTTASRAAAAANRNTLLRGGVGGGGKLSVVLKGASGVGTSVLVDNHGHAVLAVRASAAEEPQRPGVVDHDGESGNLAHGRAGRNVLEAGPDGGASAVGSGDGGKASLVEAGLSDGVSSSPELELDHGAGCGSDSIGPELGASGIVDRVAADGNDVEVNVGLSLSLGSKAHEGGGDKGGEVHFS
jgi:hypothetical protein